MIMRTIILLGAVLICAPALETDRVGEAELEAFLSQQEKLGNVQRDVATENKPIIGLDLSLMVITDRQLALLTSLKTLQTLKLFRTPVSDASLVYVGRITRSCLVNSIIGGGILL